MQGDHEDHKAAEFNDKKSPTTSLHLVITSLYLGTFLVALDTTIIGTAIPAITTAFHALDEIAWYGSSYLLTLTALQPIFGKLYKALDTKYLYLICIGIFERTYFARSPPPNNQHIWYETAL